MVKVQITKSPWGYTRITANGHASTPIVCAGVSAIMWGLAGTILNLKEKPNINTMVMNDGHFIIDVDPIDGDDQKQVDTCFTFAAVALGQIGKNSPEDIVFE